MLVIIGPSASGKTQIVNQLIKEYNMEKMVTYTTRKSRVGEVDGKDYYFLTEEEFLNKMNEGFFLETVCYNNSYYGTAKNSLTKNKVVIIEKKGLKTYIKKARESIKIVFIRASKPIRYVRMKERQDSIESIQKRLENDDFVFDKETLNLADYIVDTSNSNVYRDAKRIYEFYKPFLK